MPEPPALTLPTIPAPFLDTLAALARETFGKAAPEGPVLSAAVQRLSRRYTRNRGDMDATHGEPAALTARLRYFLPRDLYKVWGPLSELKAAGAVPSAEKPRLLDLGCGLGTTSLGVGTFLYNSQGCRELQVLGLDADEVALQLCQRLLAAPAGLPSPRFALTTARRALTLDGPLPPGPFDLITVGLSLNELLEEQPEDRRVDLGYAWLLRLSSLLNPDGALIVLEPALRGPARTLQAIRDRFAAESAGPRIFAPCLGTLPCPLLARRRDWCHERLPLSFPAALASLSRDAGLREETITYSYLTLRPRGGNLAQLAPPDQRPYRVVGGPVPSKGKVEYSLCGAHDAPQLVHLNRHRSRADERTHALRRGTVVGLQPRSPEPSQRMRLDDSSQLALLLHWSKAGRATE